MTDREQTAPDGSRPNVLAIFPGGAQPGSTEITMALLVLGSMAALYGIRRGVKGLGPVELAGSTLSAAEFAAYLIVVGTILRLVTIQWADRPIGKALSFIY